MVNRLLPLVSLSTCLLVVSCGPGGPKKAWDRAFGRSSKDKPFVADVSKLKGAYTLNSVKKWDGRVSTTYGIDWTDNKESVQPNITMYIMDGYIEIASRNETPLKTCGVPQVLAQGPSNRLEIAANDACKALSLVIIQQDATKFVVVMDEPFSCPQIGTVMCTGLEFSFAPDFKLAEQMYVWPSDLTAKMPPKIKSLQHSDVSPDDLEASRSRFKSELTAASVVLNQELTLSLGDGFSAGYMVGIINGQVIARSELIKNIVSKAETIDTSCIVESQTLKALPKFQRKLGKLEVRHVNRTEGLWIFDQLHAGLDSILTPEQRRAPSEHKFSMTEIRNSVTITVEAADSEKNGKGTKIDNDLKITCDKNREGGPIGIDDLKKAFGNVITFSK